MLHSETLALAVHADRVRDIERAIRDRRLLAGATSEGPSTAPATVVQPAPAARRATRGDSANLPA